MKLFRIADQYCRESSWETLALLKFCMFSVGLLVGMQVPEKKRKAVFGAGLLVFAASYVPLMTKLYRLWTREDHAE